MLFPFVYYNLWTIHLTYALLLAAFSPNWYGTVWLIGASFLDASVSLCLYYRCKCHDSCGSQSKLAWALEFEFFLGSRLYRVFQVVTILLYFATYSVFFWLYPGKDWVQHGIDYSLAGLCLLVYMYDVATKATVPLALDVSDFPDVSVRLAATTSVVSDVYRDVALNIRGPLFSHAAWDSRWKEFRRMFASYGDASNAGAYLDPTLQQSNGYQALSV